MQYRSELPRTSNTAHAFKAPDDRGLFPFQAQFLLASGDGEDVILNILTGWGDVS